jgi:DNA-binding XRE family transcriptional regulator
MAILNKLKLILLEKGYTQNELCDAINISKSTLSNIISNKQNATLETAFDIAEYLKLPIEDIFYKSKPNKEAEYQFIEMIKMMNEIYSICEHGTIKQKDSLKSIYKSIIEIYTEKYGLFVRNTMFINCLNDEHKIDINPIAIKVFQELAFSIVRE